MLQNLFPDSVGEQIIPMPLKLNGLYASAGLRWVLLMLQH